MGSDDGPGLICAGQRIADLEELVASLSNKIEACISMYKNVLKNTKPILINWVLVQIKFIQPGKYFEQYNKRDDPC